MDILDTKKLLLLHTSYDKVYGPYYVKAEGRYVVCLYKTGGNKRSTISYAKALLEVSLGRLLLDNEEADHIDNNAWNDVLSNLRVLSSEVNRARIKTNRSTKTFIDFSCPCCRKAFQTSVHRYITNQLQKGGKGPYCSRSCAMKSKDH